MAAMDLLIQTHHLDYRYELPSGGSIQALKDVSLSVSAGEFVGIVGHNGSGKSTLAKCMSGLLLPASGTVRVLGLDPRDKRNHVPIRQAVGLVLQNPDNQFVATVVEEEVAFGAENLGVPAPLLRQRVDQALADTGLVELRLANPHTLSAGQKTRLAVAGVLAMAPRCIILDESSAMLDPVARVQLLNLLHRLNHGGMAVVMITHYMHEVLEADTVIVLDGGRVALQGTPQEVFAQWERLLSLGLDIPAIMRLAYRLGKRGLELGIPMTTGQLVEAYRASSHG